MNALLQDLTLTPVHYLASHHAPDPAERKAVRDYLEQCCD
jgi:hypothetical protein